MIFRFGKYAFLFLIAVLSLSAFCAEPTAEEFLQRARNPNSVSTYGKFYGVLQHRRRGREPQEMPLFFGVIITPRDTVGRILVNRSEAYMIRQTRDAGRDGTSVSREPQNAVILDYVGLDGTTLSAVVSCRVLLLESPDDNPGGKEYVKVYLEKEHAFPLKAEFFRKPDDKKPFRLMEANGFTKKNDLYYARSILVEGPGWRTKVEFDPKSVALGIFDNTIPKAGIFFP